MEVQHNFATLSVATPSHSNESFVHTTAYESILRESVEICSYFQSAPAAVVLSEYPYRIYASTEAFATSLGFKSSELNKASLRLAFGPDTDLKKIKIVVTGKTKSEDNICLYRKDGGELSCSVRSHTSNMTNGEMVCSIYFTINNSAYKPAQSDVKHVLKTPSENDEKLHHDKKTGPSRFDSVLRDTEPLLTSDPVLLVHLDAIRRSRKAVARTVVA